MEYGLIGSSPEESFLAPLHARLSALSGHPYAYETRALPPERLGEYLARRAFRGINVTGPYERAVLPYLDRLSPEAEAIGAADTIVRRDGALWGYHTRSEALRGLVERMGLDLAGKNVLVLGEDAAARAVARSLGAAEIVSGEDPSGFPSVRIVINTTPCGLDDLPVDLARFPRLEGVVDAACEPLCTRLVSAARARGVPAEGGLYLRAAQALRSAGRFLGVPWSDETAETLYRELRSEKENLVLIGMPGSGKSSIGRELAALMGREFVDLDDWVVARGGSPIVDIFAQKGEEYFRALESEGVRAVAPRQGLVVATGGGCVLRAENTRLLGQNGVMIFLDRTPAQLAPTFDRPLANTRERLEQLYRERHALYAAAADVTVDYYAPAELPRPLASVAERIAQMLRQYEAR